MDQSGTLLREVARLHEQLQRDSIECCGGTTSAQCYILTELGRSGGNLTLADLVRRLDLDKAWLSRTVEALAQEGLLEKRPGMTDRRTIHISLTEAGQARLEELNTNLNNLSERIMNRIPPSERGMVLQSLHLLYHALAADTQPKQVTITEIK